MPNLADNQPVICLTCGRAGEPTYEEVDVGVGVQRFQVGWECSEHGGICGVRYCCGIADRVGYTHESWCPDCPGVTITLEMYEAETDKLRDEVVNRFRRG